MSHYLIEQLAALPNVEIRTGSHAVAAEGDDGHLRALRVRDAGGAETVEAVDACFVFIGAAPRTDWLEGVVARDERGFILAGADAKGAGWPLRARPLPARDHRAGRVRRRRRPRTLDQTRGERGRRGLDGRLVDPRIPGAGMSTAQLTAVDLRPVDLFDELDDEQLAVWAAAAEPFEAAPGDILFEPAEPRGRPAAPARGHRPDAAARRGARGAARPPGGAHLDRRDRRAHRRDAGRAHAGRVRVPAGADPRRPVHRARAREPGRAPADHAPDQPGDDAADGDRAEPRAARLAGDDGSGARARAQQPSGRCQARGVRSRRRPGDRERHDPRASSRQESRARMPSGSCASTTRRSSGRPA